MTDDEIRLEALRLAQDAEFHSAILALKVGNRKGKTEEVVARAEAYTRFLTGQVEDAS